MDWQWVSDQLRRSTDKTHTESMVVHIIQDVLCYASHGNPLLPKPKNKDLDELFLKCQACIENDCLQDDVVNKQVAEGFAKCLTTGDVIWKKFMITCALAWSKSFRLHCIQMIPPKLRRGQLVTWLRLHSMLQAFAENKPLPWVKESAASTREFVEKVTRYMCKQA